MPGVDRLAGQRLPQRLEILGEDRDDIDAHDVSSPAPEALGRVDLDDSVGERHRGDDGARRTAPAFRRASPRRARTAIRPRRSAAPRRRCRPSRPSVVTHPQALELMVVELVGIVDGGSSAESTTNSVPRNASAAARSATPARRSSSRPQCSRADSTVNVRSGRAGLRPRSSVPARNAARGRRCGPRRPARRVMPCDLATRPTTSSIGSALLSVSTTSTRMPRPPMPATRVRSAVAVRPPRPITLPRSSGCTCTSTVRPRRPVTISTRTSSGLATIPRTRCSTASATTALISVSSAERGRGLSAAALGGAASAGARSARRRLRRPWRPSWRGLLLLGWWPRRRLALGLRQRGVEQLQLARLGLLDLQRALGARQALELLPVAGDLQQVHDGLGGLGADAEPVLRTLGVDLDEAGLFLGVVLADGLDGTAVAAGASVGDDDAVLGIADLAEAG